MGIATEQQGVEGALERLPYVERQAATLLARVREHLPVEDGAAVLDVGAAQGLLVLAMKRNGLDARGVEPWAGAREAGAEIAAATGTELDVRAGSGEEIPYEDETFELVTAYSVMEHVVDPDAVFREVHRVLRPGGGFFFYTTSGLCPRQHEIRLFPLFPWYPDRVRKGLMNWASAKHPWLVSYTEMPALHWFTPAATERALGDAGYRRVFDRWELKRVEEVDGARRSFLAASKRSRALRRFGDVLVRDSAYLAIK